MPQQPRRPPASQHGAREVHRGASARVAGTMCAVGTAAGAGGARLAQVELEHGGAARRVQRVLARCVARAQRARRRVSEAQLRRTRASRGATARAVRVPGWKARDVTASPAPPASRSRAVTSKLRASKTHTVPSCARAASAGARPARRGLSNSARASLPVATAGARFDASTHNRSPLSHPSTRLHSSIRTASALWPHRAGTR